MMLRRVAFASGGLATMLISAPRCSAETVPSFRPSVVLTLPGARRAMAAAASEADANKWAVTIAVTDAGGVPLLVERHGAAPMTVDIACGKARTAALSGKETSVFEKSANGGELKPRMALLSAPLLLMEGGVPIVVDGVCVGAIGVSGVRSDQDAQIAKMAGRPLPVFGSRLIQPVSSRLHEDLRG